MKLEKTTKKSAKASHRSYEDACGAAHALELVGERWGLLVMRELLLGPKRFSDIKADLPGISANVLTQRLKGLEAAGILIRRKLPPPGVAQVYELTPWGYESEPILQVLGRWAARSPTHDPSLPLSAVSLFLSFRTLFDATRAEGMSARIGFRLGEETFLVNIDKQQINVTRGSFDGADLILSGTPAAVAAAVYGGVPFAVLAAQGMLACEGDKTLAERFVTLFPLPPKIDTVCL